eukprot:CAMPEP_0184996762 /NCGR_PEP_ID=MMETSP1098-20130426/57544_1 /TAXON_ID=89044 /ORGANISM="Spumella elongata, Strain CCAP 955/1" /LENGTH=176 /DNA_ID=CAMNT_0027523285 /DNA_START=54 /DNA_END=584 /DNA_ORIENTATION=-
MSFSISMGMRLTGRFRRLGLSLHRFSDLHHLPPSTETTPGYCLVRAVRDNGLSTVKAALESGVDPNFRSEENVTPLMIAAESNEFSIAAMLIQYGAGVNLQDDLGETALMKAARSAHKDIVELLLHEGAQTDIFNYEQMTAREATLDVEVDELLAGTGDLNDSEAVFNSHNPNKKK